jgi:RNase P/RNase MRP subunit p29
LSIPDLSTQPSELAVIASTAPTVDIQSPARAERAARRENLFSESIKRAYTVKIRGNLLFSREEKGSTKGGGCGSIYGWTL